MAIKVLLVENERREEQMAEEAKSEQRGAEARQAEFEALQAELKVGLAARRSDTEWLHPGEGQYPVDDPRSELTVEEQQAAHDRI